jgi:hypothetical protein
MRSRCRNFSWNKCSTAAANHDTTNAGKSALSPSTGTAGTSAAISAAAATSTNQFYHFFLLFLPSSLKAAV